MMKLMINERIKRETDLYLKRDKMRIKEARAII